MRYLTENDFPMRRPVFKHALMQIPYIDEQEEMVAWREGQILPIVGRLDDGSLVLKVRNKKGVFNYVIEVDRIGSVLVELFNAV